MAAGLQPSVELLVVDEQDALANIKETITADGLDSTSGLPDVGVPLRKLSRTWTYHGPSTEYRDRDNRLLTSVIEISIPPGGPNLRRVTQSSSYTESDATGTSLSWNYSTATNLNAAGEALSTSESLQRDGSVYYGSDIANVFDSLGRITTTTQLNRFLTDQAGHRWQYAWHANGVRKSAMLGVDPFLTGGTTQYVDLWTTSTATDNLGRIRGISQEFIPSIAGLFIWNVQAGGEPQSRAVKYEYLADGHVVELLRYTQFNATTPYDINQVHGVTLYGYDGIGQTTSIVHHQGLGTAVVSAYGQVYDTGRRTTQRHVEQFSSAPLNTTKLLDSVRDFVYDNDGELKSTKDTLTVAGTTTLKTTPSESDVNGNRLYGPDTNIGKANRLYRDDLYRFRYDNEGRIIQKTAHTPYVFDNPDVPDDPVDRFQIVKGTWTTQPGNFDSGGGA